MDGVIIAGGKGTRLRGLFGDIPKVLVPIDGKPLLRWHLEFLKNNGIQKVYLTLGYLHEKVEQYLRDNVIEGLDITLSVEDKPLGTAGSVTLIKDKLNGPFVVLYGDIFYHFNLQKLIQFHQSKKGVGTIVSRPNDHPFDSDLISVDQSRKITNFYPRPRDENKYYENLVNSAVYVLEPEIFSYIENDSFSDFAKDIFPTVIGKENMFAFFSSEYFKDVGTPERIQRVERDLTKGIVEKFTKKRPALFIDRDGTLNFKRGFVTNHFQFELYPRVEQSIKKVNEQGDLAILITNQSGLARGLFKETDLKMIHNKLDTLIGNFGAKIDAKYYCPHHPDKGFEGEVSTLKVKCNCRKPAVGLLEEADSDFLIDWNASMFIGDTWRDIGCGRNKNLLTMGVLSGDADFGRDPRYQPDCLVSNFSEAVDILYGDQTVELGEHLFDKISQSGSQKNAHVISIAGQSRSGKSCLSVALCRYLRAKGVFASLLPLDIWALPRESRNEKMNVTERYFIEEIEKGVEFAMTKGIVTLKPYLSQTRSVAESTVNLDFRRSDVVIVEGVVANMISSLPDNAIKLFVEIDEVVRKSRFLSFYRWKGFEESEIEDLYNKRLLDEIPIVDRQRDISHQIISLQPFGEVSYDHN